MLHTKVGTPASINLALTGQEGRARARAVGSTLCTRTRRASATAGCAPTRHANYTTWHWRLSPHRGRTSNKDRQTRDS